MEANIIIEKYVLKKAQKVKNKIITKWYSNFEVLMDEKKDIL